MFLTLVKVWKNSKCRNTCPSGFCSHSISCSPKLIYNPLPEYCLPSFSTSKPQTFRLSPLWPGFDSVLCVMCELSLLLILSLASRGFLQVFWFSSLHKNQLVSWVLCVENIECSKKCVRSKSRPPQAVSCKKQPAITNKIFIYLFILLQPVRDVGMGAGRRMYIYIV
jgi:hypothetical protein